MLCLSSSDKSTVLLLLDDELNSQRAVALSAMACKASMAAAFRNAGPSVTIMTPDKPPNYLLLLFYTKGSAYPKTRNLETQKPMYRRLGHGIEWC